MPYKINVFTGEFDYYPDVGAVALKLAQDPTAPQSVTGAAPQFDEGITIKADKPIYVDGGL